MNGFINSKCFVIRVSFFHLLYYMGMEKDLLLIRQNAQWLIMPLLVVSVYNPGEGIMSLYKRYLKQIVSK